MIAEPTAVLTLLGLPFACCFRLNKNRWWPVSRSLPRQLTALIAIAVVALTLAAGTAEARYTLSNVIIRFDLPADCQVANPPLEVCVFVWDNSPCDPDVDNFMRCDRNLCGLRRINGQDSWRELPCRILQAGFACLKTSSPGSRKPILIY